MFASEDIFNTIWVSAVFHFISLPDLTGRKRFVLTFTHAGLVHHPDERGAELTVGRDAVLSGFKDVTHVLFNLQGAAESRGHNLRNTL